MFPKSVSAQTPLNLGFLTPHNPYDREAFSGTAWYAARALERQTTSETRILGGHVPPSRFARLFGRNAAPIHAADLNVAGLDAVLGLVASPLLDHLRQAHPALPVFHVTDATPAFLRQAYGWATPAAADATETRLVANAHATIYSSNAMARRAPGDLHLANAHPDVLPFGVNLDDLPRQCPEKPPLNTVQLLFVGIDWARKGGDIAVEALKRLIAAGQPATLTIVGACPERHREHPAIHHVGHLSKSNAKDRAQLQALYRAAHLLLLPSRGDCTPMVIPEAMAYGTPVLATDTGGIAEQIGGAGAGRVLPPMTPPDDWATAIQEMTSGSDSYAFRSDAAFDRRQAVFCWDRWADGVDFIIRRTLSKSTVQDLKIA